MLDEKQMDMNHRKSIILSLISVIIMFILYGLTEIGFFGPNPVGRTGNYNEPLIVPEPYAFAIWGLIYLGLICLPIFQWFNRQEGHQEWITFRTWFSINVILNGLWLAFASYDWLIITLLVIIAMLITLYKMRMSLKKIQAEQSPVNYWLESFVVHIYFAWITLATALNVSAALAYYKWSGFGLSEVSWSLIILPIAALIATAVFMRFRDRAYAGVIVWAFVALVVKHISVNPSIAYLSLGVAGLFAFMLLFGGNRLNYVPNN